MLPNRNAAILWLRSTKRPSRRKVPSRKHFEGPLGLGRRAVAPALRRLAPGKFPPPHLGVTAAHPPRFLMRLIIGIVLLLLGVGTLSCRLESTTSSSDNSQPAVEWVRTADGWERSGSWPIASSRMPQLHPLVVAAAQGLVSVWALVALRRDDG